MTESAVAVLVVAAGGGQRMGSGPPKVYRDLAGLPVLGRAVGPFLAHAAVDRLQVVIHPDHHPLYESAMAALPESVNAKKLSPPVVGGDSRQASVHAGLESLATGAPTGGPGWVLIHDGARPLVTAADIDHCLSGLKESPGVACAVPVHDALKDSSGGPVSRAGMWRAQTPQGFHFKEILAAHRRAAESGEALDDDAAVATRAGLAVKLTPGRESNLKMTTPEDFNLAASLLTGGTVRTGFGCDAHRFCPGNQVVLCGVPIPHPRGLDGHSDADVGLHALCDALLGALALGDIGDHFPPDDPRWRDADSSIFVRHALQLAEDSGCRVDHADITLICESPPIAPYREAMCRHVASLLKIPPNRVSVKATTTDGMGFTGRGEGIAAQALVTLRES